MVSTLSKAEMSTIWENDPLNANSQETITHLQKLENDPEHVNIDGTIGGVEARTLSDLSKRIRPAIVEDGKLMEIDTTGRKKLTNCFNSSPELGKELVKPLLVRRVITLHRFPCSEEDFFRFFRPTVGEVLLQLPMDIKESNRDLYYTTVNTKRAVKKGEDIYDVALTTVYLC